MARSHLLCRLSLMTLLASALMLTSAPRLSGHKPVTSKYTYSQDVFPIVRQKCAPCHVRGGPSPMSLMTYQDAAPWAESIREELTAERMPPWFIDPVGPRMLGVHTLSARDLDVLLTWAAGGAPEGAPNDAAAQTATSWEWSGGVPDLALPLPEAHTLPPNVEDDTRDFVVPTGLTKEAWVAAVDLRPGTPSMVRSAIIGVRNGPVLGVWLPGHELTRAQAGTGFPLPAGAVLDVRIRYKKPWQEAQNALSDRSTVGLFFTKASEPVQPILVQRVEGSAMQFSRPGRVVAVRLMLDQPYAHAEVTATGPDGKTVKLLSVRKPRPEWMTRYWLAEPVQLPATSTLEVHLTSLSAGAESRADPAATPQGLGVEICSTASDAPSASRD